MRLKTLVLHVGGAPTLSYWDDWVEAFAQNEKLDTALWEMPVGRRGLWKAPLLLTKDLIVLLHSVFTGDCSRSCRFPASLIPLARRRRGKLVVFLGNEYKDFAFKNSFLAEIRCDLPVSMLPRDVAEKAYPEFASRLISLPHGVNERVFRPVRTQRDRAIDLGTRGVPYPPRVGDTDRNDLIEFVSRQNGLKIDVSQSKQERFDRSGWASFLNSCRATPTTEAGSRYVDAGGVFQERVDLTVARGEARPDFEEIANQCRAEGHQLVSGKHITGRHFEAMAAGTVQVMFPGRFMDILKPDVHYLALNRDFSNWDEVKDSIRDEKRMQRIADQARDLVMSGHTYRHRMSQLMEALDAVL